MVAVNSNKESVMLQWTESAGEHHAEGFYGRKFRIFAEGDRWRAEAECIASRLSHGGQERMRKG